MALRGEIERIRWQLTASAGGRIVRAIPECCVFEELQFHLGNISQERESLLFIMFGLAPSLQRRLTPLSPRFASARLI